ncbi:MAG: alpha/beta hydrolase, partial [Candidatus Eisenbacteria bacterium]|nr:alpha/beta hydrolase [Candidatus Eisenbacteria bacterium]
MFTIHHAPAPRALNPATPLLLLPLLLLVAVLGATSCETMAPDEPGALVPATVDQDLSLPSIELNGTRFHAETFGNPSNPVIVFLHGGPGGDYRSALRLTERFDGYSLTDDYFMVLWDQRGAGLSQRNGKDRLKIDVYVRDLDALIDRYSPGRPAFLIGVSWGGMYATRYINEHPEKVAGAVLIEPGPLDGETAERIKDDIFDMDLGSEWLNDWAWNSQFFSADDHARMDFERLIGMKDGQPRFHLSTTDPEPVWRLGAAANRYITEDGQDNDGVFNYDFTTHLSEFATPVLFLTGSMSEVLGESLQKEQMKHYPSASLVVVEGAGHDVAWVNAAEVVGHIRAYLFG